MEITEEYIYQVMGEALDSVERRLPELIETGWKPTMILRIPDKAGVHMILCARGDESFQNDLSDFIQKRQTGEQP